MSDTGDDLYLKAIRGRYADLDSWMLRGARLPPEEPQPRSELALDDSHFPSFRLSETARLSLVAGGEHLRLVRDAIESGNLYPTAHFTTIRGALVGAAQAVWLLGADEPSVRRDRGLAFVEEMHRQMDKYYQELFNLDLTATDRKGIENQKRWLAGRNAEVGALRTSALALNQTSMIGWSLDFVFKDKARRDEGRLLWRQVSADAHTLMWSMVQRASGREPERSTGLAIHQVGGDLSQIAQPFVCAHTMLKRGWSLFDQRCEG